MAQNVKDLMSTPPVTVDMTESVAQAAEQMRENEIGDVLVVDNGQLVGLVTDRDLALRVLAEGSDATDTRLADVVTTELVTLSPDDSLEDAVMLMRAHAIRRLPVCVGNEVIGVVSLGDLAIDKDKRSALADISRAPAND
jgi:CBS domain-containing protein